jgi:ribosomal-protein-alanine N-acetyltransferase
VRRQPLVLEAATEEDAGALAELERRCFSHPWVREHFASEIASQALPGVLLLRAPLAPAGTIVAYAVIRVVVDELHVQNIAVVPEARRLGLARWLLRELMRLGRGRGATRALLEVRRSNTVAQDLYRSEGFVVVGARTAYYRSPVEDALLLTRQDLSAEAILPPSGRSLKSTEGHGSLPRGCR